VEHLAALGAAFGIDPQATDWRPRIQLTDAERQAAERTWRLRAAAPRRGRRLLLNVSAGKTFRQWPDERFVSALRHVRAQAPEVAVLVIGAPGEAERVAHIAREGGAVDVATPSVRDALALVATADMVFTPDTSIGHAASAFGTPAVVMHIRGTAERWGLYGTRGHHVSSVDKTLASIPLEAVLAALDDLLVSIRTESAVTSASGPRPPLASAPAEREAAR
jgi:ADP-heptose:LPS heptosyltransferase